MQRISQNQRRRGCLARFARWRHRGEVCRLRLHLVDQSGLAVGIKECLGRAATAAKDKSIDVCYSNVDMRHAAHLCSFVAIIVACV